jgi:hypothetical protein
MLSLVLHSRPIEISRSSQSAGWDRDGLGPFWCIHNNGHLGAPLKAIRSFSPHSVYIHPPSCFDVLGSVYSGFYDTKKLFDTGFMVTISVCPRLTSTWPGRIPQKHFEEMHFWRIRPDPSKPCFFPLASQGQISD